MTKAWKQNLAGAVRVAICLTAGAALVFVVISSIHSRFWIEDPKVGEVWRERDVFDRSDNPFKEVKFGTARVVAVKDGWVQFVLSGWGSDMTLESRIAGFKANYER